MSKRKASMPQEPTGKIARADSSGKNPCSQEQLKTQKSGVTTSSFLATTKKSENSTTTPSGSKSSEQELKNLAFEDGTKKNADHQASLATEQSMPSNSELEALITTLESNDTYKIFAEPVDARKVPGYYRRIKEPMDFATLRGKLQKGLYTNLDQFERDVHLIFNNAMVANPPTTVFYKEASNLQALALKKILALKLDQDMVKFSEIVRSVEQNCNEQVGIKIEIEESGGLNASKPSAGEVCRSVGQISSGKASPSIGHSLSGKANPSVSQISSGNASTSIGQSSLGTPSPSIPQSSSGKANPSVGQSSAGKANPSVGQSSSGAYMGQGDIINTHGSPKGRNVNFSNNEKPQTQRPQTPINQTNNTASEVCHVTKEHSPVSFIPNRLQQNPPLNQNAGNENLQHYGEKLPDHGAMMQPEAELISTNKPCYTVEVFNLNSSIPSQERSENASKEFGPLSFLPDWLRESQPGYDVKIINRDSSLPPQEGPSSTGNKSTMQKIDFNSRKLYQRSASTMHSGQPVVLSPPVVQNAGNVNLQLNSEQLPYNGAMTRVTRPGSELMPANRPLYKVEVFRPTSNMPTQGSFHNASNDFAPLDFLPDWLRQSQPGYDVHVTIRDSSLPGC